MIMVLLFLKLVCGLSFSWWWMVPAAILSWLKAYAFFESNEQPNCLNWSAVGVVDKMIKDELGKYCLKRKRKVKQ
jgi:hypothetical protein